jgi:hypothetical protein
MRAGLGQLKMRENIAELIGMLENIVQPMRTGESISQPLENAGEVIGMRGVFISQ